MSVMRNLTSILLTAWLAASLPAAPAARRTFQRQNPCPANGNTTGPCPGYVVDHVIPLKRGGADVRHWERRLFDAVLPFGIL